MKSRCNQSRLQACHPKWKGKNFQQENKREILDAANELPLICNGEKLSDNRQIDNRIGEFLLSKMKFLFPKTI